MRDDHYGNNNRGGGETSKKFKKNKSSKTKKNKNDQQQHHEQQPTVIPAISIKYNQALLSSQNHCTTTQPPKVVIHKHNAIVSSDKYIHFYTFSTSTNTWVQTTSVSLPNTTSLSVALCNNTAVIGVPYDRNSKGYVTGAAYIFEKDVKSCTWYQVKKIVPKNVQEYATVGYCVDICDNVVVVGVPELGCTNDNILATGGGSVYVYQRAEQYKWYPMGHLTMKMNTNYDILNTLSSPGGMLSPSIMNFGSVVALRHKIMVVSNYTPDLNGSGETSLFVYEYDISIKNKWKLIQSDLLSTQQEQQGGNTNNQLGRNFGSHIALTNDGNGIFIGCHANTNPTEILYYKRNVTPDMYGNRAYVLQQIITLQEEECSISNLVVDGHDNFILGTMSINSNNNNHVYVYQQIHDITTMTSLGWQTILKLKAQDNTNSSKKDKSQIINDFGTNVSMYGNNILIGSMDNVYSYSMEECMEVLLRTKKKKLKKKSRSSSRMSNMIRSRSRGRSNSRGRFKFRS